MENSIQIFIGGDFCPIGRNEKSIKENKFDSILGGMKDFLSHTDLCILNLEAPLTTSTNNIPKSGPNIKADPKAIHLLQYASVNLVTLANNHIMDYGKEGLSDTLKICEENGIHTVGAGMSRESIKKPYIFEKNGKKLAILNFAENEFNRIDDVGANTIDFISNYHQILEAKNQSDFLMLIVHGGREHYQLPTPNVRERYRFFCRFRS